MTPFRFTLATWLGGLSLVVGATAFQLALITVVYLRDRLGIPSGWIDLPIIAVCAGAGILVAYVPMRLWRRTRPEPR